MDENTQSIVEFTPVPSQNKTKKDRFWIKVVIPILAFCLCVGGYQGLKYLRINTCIKAIQEDAEYEIENEDAEDYIEADVHVRNVGIMGFSIDCDYKLKGTEFIGGTRTYMRGVLGNTPTISGQITTVLWVILVSSVILSEAVLLSKHFGWNKIITGVASVALIGASLFGSAWLFRKVKVDTAVKNGYETAYEVIEDSEFDGTIDIKTEFITFWNVKLTYTTTIMPGDGYDPYVKVSEELHDVCPWR